MKWTRRFREKREPEPERVLRPPLIGLALTLLVLVFVYAYPRLKSAPRRDFDGRVVEKYVAIRESYVGSATLPRLVVEITDGRRFNLDVSDDQYARAKVGMRVSRRDSELTLSWDEPAAGVPGGEGERMEAR